MGIYLSRGVPKHCRDAKPERKAHDVLTKKLLKCEENTMMHKTKSAKFSLAIKIASILTCVSVMAVGFASWLILKPAEDVTKDGAFTVYTVDDAQLVFNNPTLADSTVKFGKPETLNAPYSWLRPPKATDTDNKIQDLAAKLTFDIYSGNDSVLLSETGLTAYVKFAPGAKFNSAVAGDVIGVSMKATVDGVAGSPVTYDEETGYMVVAIDLSSLTKHTVSVVVDFTYAWGSAFGGNNPYTYYNGQAYTEPLAGTALTKLQLVEAIDTETYTVTLTTTNPTPAN